MLSASCNYNQLFKHHIYLPDYLWNQEHKIYLKSNIDKDITNATITLSLRLDRRYLHPHLKFELMTKPLSHQEIAIVNTHHIPLRDAKGKRVGDTLGDIWDIKIPLQQGIVLKKGIYEFEMNHLMPRKVISGIMAIGLIIEQ